MANNDIYSWGPMGSMDTGMLTTADGKAVSMSKVNELGNIGPVEQLTEAQIEELLNEKRDNDRAADFTRLNVNTNVDIATQAPRPQAQLPQVTIAQPTPALPPGPIPPQLQQEHFITKSKPAHMAVDELWEEVIDLQDQLRKLYLELGGRKVKGASKWLMDNVKYINSSQMEGIGIRNGYDPSEAPTTTE